MDGQFCPKILFFSWAPSFGSYIDDQNLNGPLGLKRPIQAAHAHMTCSSLNCPVLGFCHQYATQIKALMKKIRFLGKIGWSIVPIISGSNMHLTCPDLFGHIFILLDETHTNFKSTPLNRVNFREMAFIIHKSFENNGC